MNFYNVQIRSASNDFLDFVIEASSINAVMTELVANQVLDMDSQTISIIKAPN